MNGIGRTLKILITSMNRLRTPFRPPFHNRYSAVGSGEKLGTASTISIYDRIEEFDA
jgi:hypothetical protein